MDIQPLNLLDGAHNRRLPRHDRLLHHHASHLPLPALYLPTIRRFSLRGQRLRTECVCGWGDGVLGANVQESGGCEGMQFAWGLDVRVCGSVLLFVLLWGGVEEEESVCC